MNTTLVIITSDKTIGIGTTIISGIGTDMSWIPSDVHAVHWDGSSGEIEYNDGKANLGITSIGIYSQADTTFNNGVDMVVSFTGLVDLSAATITDVDQITMV